MSTPPTPQDHEPSPDPSPGGFSRRDAETLLKIAAFFDAAHDDGKNLKTLKEVIALCQQLLTLGAIGRLLISVLVATLAIFAALATLSNKVPSIDQMMHWGSGHPP